MATTGFNVKFYILYGGIVVPGVIIEDTTDYAGQGISPSNLNGNIKLTAPSGVVVYDNTDFSDSGCDYPSVAARPADASIVNLPVLSNGTVQRGKYTILYTVYNKNLAVYYTLERQVDFEYVRPVLNIDNTVDYDATLFTSKDNTNYVVNGVDVAVSFYDHNLYYPPLSAGAGSPLLTTDLNILTTVFYPGTQTATVQALNSWIFDSTTNNTFSVFDSIIGSKETVVSTNDLCSLYCCLKKFSDRLIKAKCANHKSYSELQLIAGEIGFLIGMINTAKTCGHTNDITGFFDEIKSLVGCSDDCDEC